MATETLTTDVAEESAMPPESPEREPLAIGEIVQKILKPLASLKLTVVLFVLAMFIVLAGTLAQTRMDIWDVVNQYFRTAFAWIDFQVFFPQSFFPGLQNIPGGMYFPGGWLIGAVMAVNLLAAHTTRFRIQASGKRLYAGIGVLLCGMVVTWLVIQGGSTTSGVQGSPMISYGMLWQMMMLGLAASFLATVYGVVRLWHRPRMERIALAVLAALIGGLLVYFVSQGAASQLSDSSMRILWQLTQGGFAGLVLLAGCVLVFRKRAGIVLLHGGIGLMMFSELLVGTTAVEGQMTMREGETVNYAQDIRSLELAVVDRSDPEEDAVVVVPGSMLDEDGTVVRHESLPFDVEVVRYYRNSEPRRLKPDEEPLATAGTGTKWTAEERRPGTGTDAGGKVDLSAAWIRLTDSASGADLGTYMVSLFQAAQDVSEKVTVDGKTYDVSLRFKRLYKPYTMTLEDVRKDDYVGTDTPRNYSSDVTMVSEEHGIDSKFHIWMNNPLRALGETFYQSNYFREPGTGVESTTLAVVTNTGWMIPYVSCMIVAVGMLAQFLLTLLRFVKRQAPVPALAGAAAGMSGAASVAVEERPASLRKNHKGNGQKPARGAAAAPENGQPAPTGGDAGDSRVLHWFSLAIPVLMLIMWGGWLAGKTRIPETPVTEMDLYEFGQLPVVYQGRTKPLDTLARNALRIVSDRQDFTDASGEKQPAIRWLLDLLADPATAREHKVFRIENLTLLDTLGLEPREGFRYSIAEFAERLDKLSAMADEARKLEAVELEVYQKKALELERQIGILDLMMQAFEHPQIRPDHVREDLIATMQRQQRLKSREPPLVIPPQETDEEWRTYSEAWLRGLVMRVAGRKDASDPVVAGMNDVLVAWADKDTTAFNSAVTKTREAYQSRELAEIDEELLQLEAWFNHFEPFYHATVLYIVAFVFTGLGWIFWAIGWQKPFLRTALWLIAFTFVLHTVALALRIEISGRPPVTNLYSSAVFIGWGAVVLGLILEVVFRLGFGNAIAAVAGFSTLMIAHFLAGDGDTFTVMQAVLDTQFWLATHVVCITLGYATTFVAGLLGLFYVLGGFCTPALSRGALRKDLSRMIYGILCFAIFFSFVGTVLGGLWADDSWGRFWGWDPKENGALLIVLWNAIVLHARWGAMVKDRGMAVLAIGGNIVTAWSWFGVNELGVGLHSYGFTEGVPLALGIAVLGHLAVIGIGLLPDHMWWSLRREQRPATGSTA